ncbi:hypothetical protein C5167_048670 [Papaver somniferum]|uniref:EF-hand domain-containing protein n=1 Tax=Papaver somniferum TaxID=3469 RepID=A0A4Y7KMM1_PAPSO|nr:probable calcium-binding protein CML23 [Papaver somniferum]RZC73189.1 hypothetical protein C5167_048670 [Papaver somniferum]
MFSSLKNCISPVTKKIKETSKRIRRRSKQKKLLAYGVDLFTSPFTSMEVPNQLKQVFKLIDTNGDGKISSLELGEVLLCLGHEKSTVTKEAEVMLKEVDCNGDGFIDLDEFMNVVAGDSSSKSKGADEDLKDAFLVFDADKNGFISPKELKQVLRSLGYYKCTLSECSAMIKGVDKDGDGLVNFEEFRSMMNGCRS